MLRQLFYIVSIFLVVLLTFISYSSANEKAAAISVELVSSDVAITPGTPFRLAARFSLKKPWHIYWKNPGKIGLPTKVTFQSSSGIHVGELEWPEPITFTQPGGELGYGYEDEVALGREIITPENFAGDSLTIEAKVKWLGCSPTSCIPGRKTLSITLPVKRN